MSDKTLSLGQRVIVVGKDVKGSVAYVGHPTFASGKWIGVILDEPKGKNNGTVRGHAYFRCEENYGVFVRQTQIQMLDVDDNPMETSMTASAEEPRSTTTNRRLSSSRTSLASSRQSLTSYASPTTERAASPDTGKRAAFVETGFVETLTPQYTPGQSITSPQPTTVEDKLANLQAQQEITQLKSEVEDLKEKLETIKLRRAEDREKLRELERVRLQLDQANEFKTKIMESQAQLQRDLQRAKQEVRDAQEALDVHNDETAELQEAAEMAALDKEMAEERAESLQMELEQCREKLEEATLDLQLMKAEMEAGGNIQHPYSTGDGGATGYEIRQLQQQNVRLRDTLVRLRDLSAHDKHAMQKMQKDIDQYKSEIAELNRSKEKMSLRVDELEAQVADLREQVDAALGAEEMLEQLADRKMALEDQVEQLKQDVSELEALQEVHEQLVESNRELEMDLRDELEMAHAATREAIREREACYETIMDRDATIVKFRELVHRMTEQYNESRGVQAKQGSPAPEQESTPEPRTSPPMELASLVQASKASTRSIDLQLRALELRQATARADMLAKCLPDNFMRKQGDHDAILLLLLLERLSAKADIVLGQIREKFPAVNVWDREVVTKTHTAVQYSFRCQLEYHLNMVQCTVSMWSEALERCSGDALLAAARTLPDALAQEKALDALLQALSSNTLDENCSCKGIERCWSYLACMLSGLGLGADGAGGAGGAGGSRARAEHGAAALHALARALHADAQAAHQTLATSELNQEYGEFHTYLINSTSTLQQQLKGIRRRLPPPGHSVPLDEQLLERLRGDTGAALLRAAQAASLCARAACACAETRGERGEGAALAHATLAQLWRAAADTVYKQLLERLRGDTGAALLRAAQAASLCARAACACAETRGERGEGAALAHATLAQLWRAAADTVYKQEEHGPVTAIKRDLAAVLSDVSKLAALAQDKEYDMMSLTNVPVDKPVHPVVQRAEMIKKQLEETKTLAIKLENKDADIKELRKALKAKQEEISELQIRREMGEKKLSTAAKDAELRAQQLNRRLEDALAMLKRKEKEYDETMDHLQQDIDSLEMERSTLRDKLKLYAKRGGSHHEESPVKIVPGVVAGEVNEALQHQLKVLSWTVERERAARIVACRKAENAALRNLRPLQHPTAPSAIARRQAANELEAKLAKLQTEWTLFVARSGLVTFPDEPSKYASALHKHKEKQRAVRYQLEERLLALQGEVMAQLVAHRPWRCVEADLAQFPKPELAAAITSKPIELGTIQYPAEGDAINDDTIYVTPTQLARLRDLVTELKSDDVKLDLKPMEVCAA